ncbi:T9SS C-terminal target domain-containing protein [bacterium]|nr:MAG: T9SS C-terminal target domain-containing protein [bacterium]
MHTAGEYRITYDASGLSSGIYFVQFKGSTFRTTQKLILIR